MKTVAGKVITGLEIEPGQVVAVETRGGVGVERCAIAPLAPGIVRDGEVVDVDALAEVLRRLFAEHKLSKRVRIGVANQSIAMRTLDLPPIREAKEIASAVRFQAQDQIPMPLEQAVLEHQSLGIIETPEGARTRVVLVAARREMIDKLIVAVRAAGLQPQGIDLSAFAMIRSLYRAGTGDATLYLSVGGITNLAIAVGPMCVFTRVVAHSLESIATALAERRGLTLEHAHGWLLHVGLEAALDEIEGDPEIVAEARFVLNEGTRQLADDLRNSLAYHAMQQGSIPVDRVILTGAALLIGGFREQLGEQLGLVVEAGVAQESRAGAVGASDPGQLAVAAGLTVEQVST